MIRWLSRLFRNPAPRVHPLVEQARGDDSGSRAKAAAELGTVAEPWAPGELVRLLGDTSAAVREAAKDGLCKLQRAAVPALLEALRGPRLDVNVAAAELLGELRAPEAVEPLLVALKFSERPLQNAAFRALERSGPVALRALWAVRDEVDPWTRAQIEELLAKGLEDLTQAAPPAANPSGSVEPSPEQPPSETQNP